MESLRSQSRQCLRQPVTAASEVSRSDLYFEASFSNLAGTQLYGTGPHGSDPLKDTQLKGLPLALYSEKYRNNT
jgi:hypothetical protein